MAREALAVQTITRAGITPTYGAAHVDGQSLPNTGVEFIHVKTAGTACDVTIVTPGTVDGLAVTDRTVSLGATAEKMIGPFPPSVYNQPGTSDVYINFTAVTAVTIAALRAK